MTIEYYNEYLHFKNIGIKPKAKEAIEKFIKSFYNYSEKESWTLEYLPKLDYDSNGRIRNELFEDIIFPVLLDGYNNKNIQLMIWLVKLNQNIYQNNRIWKKIDYKSKLDIIEECYSIDPDNVEIIELYLEIKIEKLNFIMHEYPNAILFGNYSRECKVLLEEMLSLKKLDKNNKFNDYFNEYEKNILEYMNRE